MKRHWKLWITGKVQGVYFRNSAKRRADELQLFGWVKNEADGSVYVEVEGSEISLKEFFGWCQQGPPNAIVKNVKIEEGAVKDYPEFEIRRV